MSIAPLYYTLTPSCYKVAFQYHPMMVKCIKRIPSARYQAEGKFWEVSTQDLHYLRMMGEWARENHFVSSVLWLEDKEPAISYEPLPMPTLDVPHNMLIEPYGYQKEGIAYALEKKRCIMGDEMGLGKEQPYSEPVLTPDGWVTMGELKIGDNVIAADGTSTKITNIYEQGIKDVYRITFSDGTYTRCGLHHLWNVRTHNDAFRHGKDYYRTLELSEIIKDYKKQVFDKRYPDKERWNYKYAIPVCGAVSYTKLKEKLPINPYILGVLIGDGCLTKNGVTISKPNNSLRKIVGCYLDNGDWVTDFDPDGMTFHITNGKGKMSATKIALKELGLDNLKSKEKFIPHNYLYASIVERNLLLNGLLDTDGHFIKDGVWEYSTASSKLADDFCTLARSLGYIVRKNERDSYYEKGGKLFHNFRIYIYGDSSRKIKSIVNIEKEEKQEQQRCIYVDHPEHLYITRDFIVTHNTVQAIGVLAVTKAFPALVVCPASLKVNWQREMKKFAGINAVILNDDNRQTWQRFWEIKRQDGKPCAEVFITNYESLKKFFVARIRREGRFTLKSVEFDERISLFRTVIIDESHKCKTKSTQQSKFVQGIAQGKEYILELTGTPVVNNNTDLIQQLTIMGRLGDFGGYSKFVARYCAGERKSSHLKELNYLLRKNCFFRRLKKDVLTQLPDKTRSYLVMDIDNMREYKAAERDVVKYLVQYRAADDEKIQRTIRGAIMVKMGILKQISARGKVRSALDIIHDTIDGGQKLIVFCFLKEVVQAIKQEFRDAVSVTGDDNDRQKHWAVDRFQTDESCRLIVLNYKSGGVGLTLTAASNVLFVEQPWTAAACNQAEDRAHRNGQKNAVNCVYLLGKGTIDEYIYNLIQQKREISNGVTGTDEDTQEKMLSEVDVMMNAAFELFGKELK